MTDARTRLTELLLRAASLVGKQENKELSLEDQLSLRLQSIDIAANDDPRTSFVHECSQLLCSIQDTLNDLCLNDDQSSDAEFLGVRDMRMVHTLLQVTISWGFYPNLFAGVGVPLSKRVKSGYTSHELFDANPVNHTDQLESQSMRQLFILIKSFVNMVQEATTATNHTTVASIIMARHLPDLYAGLLQLAYGPSKSAEAAENDPQRTIQASEREECARMFLWLFNRSDTYRAMESLMLLLGTSPLHPVPAWLRNICGRYLSRILLKPNGVNVVLDFTVGDEDQVQLAQLEKVSKLILAVPQQMPSVESYYAVIAPQLLSILQGSVKNTKLRSSKGQVVTFVVGKIIAKHTGLAQKYIVDAIVGGLLRFWNETTYEKNEQQIDKEVLSEDDLYILLHTLHCVMIGSDPSPIVIQTFLEASIPALYQLYEFTVNAKSGLRETVLDILTTYFRIMTTNEAIGALKTILFHDADLSGTRVAYFAPGPHGGAVLRLRQSPAPTIGNQFHLDPARLVEFLQTIDNADLCGDLFVYFLNEYSSAQSNMSMTDPRTILLIIQLIMQMLDTLGTSILRHPAQIIAFATNIIFDHVKESSKKSEDKGKKTVDISNIVSDEEREAIDDANDETYTNDDEMESLILALSLLRAVLYENDSADVQTVELLKSVLEPLKKIEKRQDDILQEPVHEVMLAITSFLSSQAVLAPFKKGSTDLEASKAKYRDALKALKDELLPVRAHGMSVLKEMVLTKDPVLSSEGTLGNILDLFVQLVQDEDSFIYLNAIKGLSAITDIHGNEIISKLGAIYSDEHQKVDNRLRVGEALLQTITRCGDALGKYVNTLIEPLETVLARRQEDNRLRLSALSIIGVACETYPVALHARLDDLTSWTLNILAIEKAAEIRRAAIVLILSLFRGFASQTLYSYPADNLSKTYRTLRYVEDTDPDELTRHQARVALSDLDAIMRSELFSKT